MKKSILQWGNTEDQNFCQINKADSFHITYVLPTFPFPQK